jgi:hypothetical protein
MQAPTNIAPEAIGSCGVVQSIGACGSMQAPTNVL